jgi:hypothetical protein
MFPGEIRIEPSHLPDEVVAALEEVAEAISSSASHSSHSAGELQPDQGMLTKPLADLGTHLWRLRGRMVVEETGEPKEEVRRAYRYLQSAWQDLMEMGIEIQDHVDCEYAPGMALKVLAFEPQEGITSETIVEVIKPSIYFQGKVIQMGEVIVAMPKGEGDPDDATGSKQTDGDV